jgi:hypothetical protein
MRARSSLIWLLMFLFLGTSILSPYVVSASPQAQVPYPEGDSRYFDQTGHYVSGPFLEFYDSKGGVRIFGYPQTERFYDPHLGLHVQYFDNARMEWHPQNPEAYQVQLGLLGEILGHREPPLPRDRWQANNRFRRIFPETGHMVSFAFLDFYDNHGGLDIFGYPISEPLIEGEYIVQYFQRMRMEWHPERPREDRVVLGSLGNEYIYRFGVPAEYRERQPYSPSIPQQSTPASVGGSPENKPTLHVWAAVRYAITVREGSQTVFVYVTNSRREPVEGATVTVTVRYPSQIAVYQLPATDAQGLTEVTFSIDSPPPGRRVVVDVTVEYQGTTTSAQTFFLPWW